MPSETQARDRRVASELRRLRWVYGVWFLIALFAHAALGLGLVAAAAWALTPWAADSLRLAIVAAALAAVAVSVFVLRGRAVPLGSLGQFARYLQAALNGVRQDFETALALEADAFDDPVTGAFAAAHRRRAEDELGRVPGPVLRRPRRGRVEAAALGVWLALVGAGLAFPDKLAAAKQAWLRWDGKGAGALLSGGARSTAVTAEFTFTITPPAYTGLEPETITGSGELLRAYKGSKVAVRVRLQSPAQGVRLQLPGGSVAELAAAGQAFGGEFIVTDKGPLVLGVKRADDWLDDATERKIELVPDQAPAVRLLTPADAQTFQPDDAVAVTFEASDDFGVTKAALVVDAGGGEVRFALAVSDGALRVTGGRTYALREWGVEEGAVVTYYVEVFDNDTISGPKRGTSRPQTLEIYSPRKNHEALLERMDRLFTLVVHGLGDVIELPEVFGPGVGPQLTGLAQRLREAANEFTGIAAALHTDPLADAAATLELEDLGRRTERYGREAGDYASAVSAGTGAADYPGFRPRGIGVMERIALDLAELVRRNRMNDMLLTAADLEKARDELRRLIDDYKQNPDAQKLAALKAKMAQIRKLLAKLESQRAEMAKGLPDEFLNADAFQKAMAENPASKLDDVEKLLDSDDPARALAEIEKFEQSLGGMLAKLDQAGQSANQQANAGAMEQLNKALQEVGELEQGQRKLADETRKQAQEKQEAKGAQAEQAKADVGKRLEQLKNDAVRLRDKSAMSTLWNRGYAYYAPQVLAEIERAKQAVGTGDWEGARDAVQRGESYLRNMQMQAEFEARAQVGGDLTAELERDTKRAGDKAAEIRKLLEGAGEQEPGRQAAGGPAPMQRLEQAQSKLQERLEKLRKQLDSKEGGAAPMPKEGREALQSGGEAMGKAREKMQGGQGHEAAMKADEAAEQLAQAREQLQQMKQQMEQSASRQPGGEKGGGPAGRGMDEKVAIPKTAEEKTDRRQEVMKGMREGLPKAYEDLNKKYYDRLVK